MVLDWGLNSGPPALEASTIPLGYRGGGQLESELKLYGGDLQPVVYEVDRTAVNMLMFKHNL